MQGLENLDTARQLCDARKLLRTSTEQLNRERTSQVSEGSNNSILAFILNAYCS